MIKAVYDAKALKLTVSGHAGGEKGQDLLCCAVSTLVDTLALNLIMQKEIGNIKDFTIEHKDDGSVIGCVPKKNMDNAAKLIFITICVGIENLSQQFPDKISYEIV